MSSIILQEVSLDYLIKTGSDSLKKSVGHLFNYCFRQGSPSRMRNSSYRALHGINIALQSGDRVGLLGRNGAGKSTLLRVLAKVYKPTEGQIDVQGSISSLFDINLGMNLEASGYENIVNLGIMRGMSKKVAQQMVEDIETFTELGEFLGYPVRVYSSGMLLKLAFAVATSMPPDILLIDEVIGVGDAHFMEKATQRLESTIEKSHILALTSHSTDIIKRFCNKVIVLDKGVMQFVGDVDQGIAFYRGSLNDNPA